MLEICPGFSGDLTFFFFVFIFLYVIVFKTAAVTAPGIE